MIKKLFYIAFFICLTIFVSQLLNYSGEIIITALEYQISTTTSFILLFLSGLVLFIFLVVYILFSIFSPNVRRIEKNRKKLEKKFEQYLSLITEGLVYKNVKNSKEAWAKLKKANKIFKETNLSKFLESQILYVDGKYQKSETSFKEIKNTNLNLDLLNLKNSLNQAKKTKDEENAEKCAVQILEIEPINVEALNTLLNIYIAKKSWIDAEIILKKGLKSKVFNEENNKEQILFVYTSLAKTYFDNQNFDEAKTLLRKVYYINPKYIQAIILLVETYIAMGKHAKALTIIMRTWKHTTNPKLADLYFSLQKEKDRDDIKIALKLYKLNTKSFESNFILANTFYKNQIYSKARKYAKIADDIVETKDLYELMLKIEQEDNGSSAIINILKNKILLLKNSCWKCNICKREYYNWQPECNNCKNLNSLRWNK
ncbi:MAG: tetratricopeptide repeat protein [Rickettsiales bacterium]|nr:tetratricopeptide repeat protein [Rickettsiales bacterium]